MTEMPKGIMVGYDGSPGSEAALTWGAAEARARAIDLTVCHAWSTGSFELSGESAAAEAARQHAGEILDRGVRRVRGSIGAGEVLALLANGPAARVLCEQSRDAAIVAVGSRGRGGLSGTLLGSVSAQVAAHARGPVTVVRGHARAVPGHQPGPVVVGADGSLASRGAVAFAFEEASLHQVPLYAVCALADAAGVLGSARQIEAGFDEALGTYRPGYPRVTVHRMVVPGTPRHALLETAGQLGSQILVLGARGRGGLHGMTLGSVSVTVLHHAPCPVTIIH